jgi:TetR/AcrR family transcriptional regulator, transcriptional repressor for nem operon
MPRSRAFDREAVIEAATHAFWENGYEGTAVSELERRTGLNRSSLYLTFGSKNGLFVEALDRYIADVLDPLLSPLEANPGIAGVTAFLFGIRSILLDEIENGRSGCLLINTVAERSTTNEAVARRSISFRDRLERALTRALEHDLQDRDAATVAQRAAMLLATVGGIWTWARIDLHDAAEMCTRVAAEAEAWLSPINA